MDKKAPEYRTFNVMQYEKKPGSNEDLGFTEDDIKKGLNYKTIKKYAYICHDRDIYTEDNIKKLKSNPFNIKPGDLKNRHWHICLYTNPAVPISTISRWFNVPANMVEIPKENKKGGNPFMDIVAYLTHGSEKQQALGKILYSDSDVICNFDYTAEVAKYNLSRMGNSLKPRDRVRLQVLKQGRTLKDIRIKDPFIWSQDRAALQKLRLDYLQDAEPPKSRLNFYICGQAGMGKDELSRSLARSFGRDWWADKTDDIENLDDDDLFFKVGEKNVNFEGYDGQPVVVWEDKRSVEILKMFDNSRGQVFQVFSPFPDRSKMNVKFGSVNLINSYNIVNSVQPYQDFLDGLAGEYTDKYGYSHKSEDKSQSYRRFPVLIPLRVDDFSVLLNSGWLNNNNDYLNFVEYNRIAGNMGVLARMLKNPNNKHYLQKIEPKMIGPIRQAVQEISKEKPEFTEKEVLDMFGNFGEVKTYEELQVLENNKILKQQEKWIDILKMGCLITFTDYKKYLTGDMKIKEIKYQDGMFEITTDYYYVSPSIKISGIEEIKNSALVEDFIFDVIEEEIKKNPLKEGIIYRAENYDDDNDDMSMFYSTSNMKD